MHYNHYCMHQKSKWNHSDLHLYVSSLFSPTVSREPTDHPTVSSRPTGVPTEPLPTSSPILNPTLKPVSLCFVCELELFGLHV